MTSTHLAIDEPFQVEAPAKINLWLRILRSRADGYHEIESRLAPIDLCDRIVIERSAGTGIQLACEGMDAPADESNLAVKAARALEEAAGAVLNVRIVLEKRIPSEAGLGGGSSDAAAVLTALNERLDPSLSPALLSSIAAKLGADVPFFLQASVCDVTGIGDELHPVPSAHEIPLLLVKPGFGVSTQWAYQQWGAAPAGALPGFDFAEQETQWVRLVNDLEPPVFRKYLFLAHLKTWLREQPECCAALMSGSGSTIFAVLSDSDPAKAEALAERVRARFGTGVWTAITRTR